jgi:NitT/TauT family transport system permease protein
MIVIVLIGLLADKALFAPWERFLHRRWGTGSAAATLRTRFACPPRFRESRLS